MTAQANITIAVYDNVTVYGDIQTLNLNVLKNGYYNNTVPVSNIQINTLDNTKLGLVTAAIKLKLNPKLNAGFSLNAKLENSTLGFFNLTYMEL